MTSILYTASNYADAAAFLRRVRASFAGLDYTLAVRRDHDGAFHVIAY